MGMTADAIKNLETQILTATQERDRLKGKLETEQAGDPLERIIALLTGIDYKLSLISRSTGSLSRTFVD